MKYKEENLEKAKQRLTSALCNEALIIDACQNMLAHPELVKISALDFAKIILNTVAMSWGDLRKTNAYACKMSELAAEQYFMQGHLSKEPPIQRVK